MKDYMPYIATLIATLISLFVSLRQIKHNKEEGTKARQSQKSLQDAESAKLLSEASANIAQLYADQFDELKQEVKDADTHIQELTKRLDKQDETIEGQEMKIKELERKIRHLEQENKDWSNKYSILYDWAISLVSELVKRDIKTEKPPDELNIVLPEYNKKRRVKM